MIINTVYLVAMKDEAEKIFDLTEFKEHHESGFTFFNNDSNQSVIVLTGIGKSNAAAGAQFALQKFPAKKYVNTGLVGSFNRNLALSEVIVVEKCRFFDVDVTAFDYALGQLPGCEFVEYPLKQDDAKSLKKVFLVSGDTFLNNSELRDKMVATFHPDVIDMELTSIAHIFQLHGKLDQLQSIKAVSDYADAQSDTDFYELMKNACQNLKEFFHE